ncbi:MAG: hypothetical protein E6J88_10575 [Deltaproteobacteria bacterium]|nr:MAG: hypothetical protein E6J88_10575 [Deltaproteobacteria bacterium]
MTLETRVLLVGDEVGRLLEVLDGHVHRLRQLELVGLDHLHRRVAQDQLVPAPVDAVTRRNLEGKVTAAAGLYTKATTGDGNHTRRVQHAVVQATLLEVIRLGGVPVLVRGEEAFKEVDPLEVGLLRHCILRKRAALPETSEAAVLSNQKRKGPTPVNP